MRKDCKQIRYTYIAEPNFQPKVNNLITFDLYKIAYIECLICGHQVEAYRKKLNGKTIMEKEITLQIKKK